MVTEDIRDKILRDDDIKKLQQELDVERLTLHVRFLDCVKDAYVIKNSQGEIVRLASKKFCWDSIGSANSALAHHIKSSAVTRRRIDFLDDAAILKVLTLGWIIEFYNPHEFVVSIAGEVKRFNDVKGVRKALLDSETIKIVKIN